MHPSEPSTSSHPLVSVLDRLDGVLDHAGATPLLTLDPATTAAALARLVALESRVAAVKLALLAHGDTVDVAGASGATSTTAWLAHATRTTRLEAHRQTRLAGALARDVHGPACRALRSGQLQVEQARVIVAAVDALPDDLDATLRVKAETYLVEQAEIFDAARLKVLGDRLLEVVAPDIADEVEAKRLADQERRAAQRTRLTMSRDGDGSVFIRAKVPDLHAAILKKILLAYASPKHQAAAAAQAGVPTPQRRPSPERMGSAFCDFLESIADAELPKSGGTGATVVVTMDLATLTGGLASAHLDTGEAISAGTARRLACQAGLVPVVLDGDSVSLDLGRTQRFHTRAQRIAIALRDGGCTAEGCDWPPGMCHVHHDPPWSVGGGTDVEHARMLCAYHHARAHDPAYDTTRFPDGSIRFHRRM